MRVLVLGATGTIGNVLCRRLDGRHEVIPASRNGAVRADLDDPVSLSALFAARPGIDAVICCAASVPMAPLADVTPENVRGAVAAKLFGQVELVRQAAGRLNEGGSITLTSGDFGEPVPRSAPGALANAGLEAFAVAAATEMERGIRLNVVSPGWIAETLELLDRDGSEGIPVVDVVACYVQALEGDFNGRILKPARCEAG